MNLKKIRKISLVIVAFIVFTTLIYQWSNVSSGNISNDVVNEGSIPLIISKKALSGDSTLDNIKENSITETVESRCQPSSDQKNHWKDNYQLVNDYLDQADTEEALLMSAIVGTEIGTEIGTETKLGNKAKTKQEIDNINEEKISRLSKAAKNYPENKLINYHFIDVCSTNPNNKNCSAKSIAKAIKLDGSNGALWSNIASIYLAQKNVNAAIDALQQSSTAPTFNDYRMQRIAFFNDTISDSGIVQHEAMVIAIGYEAAIAYYGIRNITEFCTEKSITRTDIAYACLEYGKRLEHDSNTMIFASMGLVYQRIAFENLNENAEVATILKKTELMRKRFKIALFDDSMFLYNIEFQEYWLQVMTHNNELDAFALLKKEAVRLKSDPSYRPCPVN